MPQKPNSEKIKMSLTNIFRRQGLRSGKPIRSLDEVDLSRLGVLVIDMQAYFLGDRERYRTKNSGATMEMIKRQQRILSVCAETDIPVAALEYGGSGPTIEELKPLIGQVPRHGYFNKDHDDGFTNKKLAPQLRTWDALYLFLMGVNASACVKATAESAIREGFGVLTSEGVIFDTDTGNLPKKYGEWYRKNGVLVPRPELIPVFA